MCVCIFVYAAIFTYYFKHILNYPLLYKKEIRIIHDDAQTNKLQVAHYRNTISKIFRVQFKSYEKMILRIPTNFSCSFYISNITKIHLGGRRFIWCQVFSILMSIISPEAHTGDVSLCFTIYQFNTPSSSHLASTILVRYDKMYPAKFSSVPFLPV